MAKFVPITGYYYGLYKRSIERFVNPDFIEKIERHDENKGHTLLIFKPDRILVVEKDIMEVIKILSL
jgi:hypothetical protein